jgi:hypothetical protein
MAADYGMQEKEREKMKNLIRKYATLLTVSTFVFVSAFVVSPRLLDAFEMTGMGTTETDIMDGMEKQLDLMIATGMPGAIDYEEKVSNYSSENGKVCSSEGVCRENPGKKCKSGKKYTRSCQAGKNGNCRCKRNT